MFALAHNARSRHSHQDAGPKRSEPVCFLVHGLDKVPGCPGWRVQPRQTRSSLHTSCYSEDGKCCGRRNISDVFGVITWRPYNYWCPGSAPCNPGKSRPTTVIRRFSRDSEHEFGSHLWSGWGRHGFVFRMTLFFFTRVGFD